MSFGLEGPGRFTSAHAPSRRFEGRQSAAFVLTYWGTTTPIADLDGDGVVGGSDMAIVLNGWTG
jgi:hypothetical protein